MAIHCLQSHFLFVFLWGISSGVMLVLSVSYNKSTLISPNQWSE